MIHAYTHHDLHITTPHLPRVRLVDMAFDVHVQCNRAHGWQVWRIADYPDRPYLLGGECDQAKPLRLDVAGLVVVDTLGAMRAVGVSPTAVVGQYPPDGDDAGEVL
jgi:hypothetical protein